MSNILHRGFIRPFISFYITGGRHYARFPFIFVFTKEQRVPTFRPD